TTETPLCSKTWSSSFALSRARAYWNPEQPPPRTATRRTWSGSSWPASSSLSLPAAASVRTTAASGVSIGFQLYSPLQTSLRIPLSVRKLEVLEDSPRVMDYLVAVDQNWHALLVGEGDDLAAVPAPLGDALGAVLETQLSQPALDRAARAQPVGRRAAAVEKQRLSVAPAHRPTSLFPILTAPPTALSGSS